MAIKLPKIPGLKFLAGTDTKSRVFIVIAAVIALAIVIFFASTYFGGGAAITGSRVASAPSMQTVPGAKMTPEFYRAVVEANVQAAKQAQITGGSAIPSLLNVPPGQQAGFPEQSCTIVCPSEDKVNVADDINSIMKLGKLPQEDAKRLLDLAKNNVPVEEYAAALDELVRQGKLTPEQARALLEKYKKQHANALINESGAMMDDMIRTGQLPLDVANKLLALQKAGVTPAEYAAELNRLVREGKLSPAAAAKLLAQYTQQQMREQAKQGNFALRQMAKSGEITPDVANTLAALQGRNATVDEYEATLNRLVAAGKMTPAAAAKLLDQYKKQRAGAGPGQFCSMVEQEEGKAAGELSALVKAGRLSQDVANVLYGLQQKSGKAEEYQNALNQLVQAKKLTPEDAQKLLASYQKLAAVRAEAQRLGTLQGNNASVNDYTEELKRAVQAGIISPETASCILAQYRALVTPLAPGVGPGVETTIPGGAEFAQLQQRLQAGEVPPTPEAETVFTAPVAAAKAETDQERQQRIEALMNAMSNQAQSLIAAWHPPVMQHKDGAPEKPKPGEPGSEAAAAPPPGGSSGISEKTVKEIKPALIKAGTILFAVLDTTVDSDYPDTPVMATIVQGPFKGAKLLGKLALAQGKDRISLNFNMMDMEGWPTTKSINAFAIDPDTARTVMASSVNYHYFKRFGAIMATSFLTGYSNAITNAGTSTVGINGITTTHPQLNPASKIAVGLGQIGTTLGASMQSYINTPATVKVNSGVGLGILFMTEVPQ